MKEYVEKIKNALTSAKGSIGIGVAVGIGILMTFGYTVFLKFSWVISAIVTHYIGTKDKNDLIEKHKKELQEAERNQCFRTLDQSLSFIKLKHSKLELKELEISIWVIIHIFEGIKRDRIIENSKSVTEFEDVIETMADDRNEIDSKLKHIRALLRIIFKIDNNTK